MATDPNYWTGAAGSYVSMQVKGALISPIADKLVSPQHIQFTVVELLLR